MSSEPPASPAPTPGQPTYVYVPRPNDNEATAALIVGILSLFGLFCYGIPALIMGPIAIYLGLHARSRINASGGMVGGHGFAMAGWIMGIVAVVLGAIYLLLMVAFFGFAIWFAVNHPATPTPSTA